MHDAWLGRLDKQLGNAPRAKFPPKHEVRRFHVADSRTSLGFRPRPTLQLPVCDACADRITCGCHGLTSPLVARNLHRSRTISTASDWRTFNPSRKVRQGVSPARRALQHERCLYRWRHAPNAVGIFDSFPIDPLQTAAAN